MIANSFQKISKQEHRNDKSLIQGHIRLCALASKVNLRPRNPEAIFPSHYVLTMSPDSRRKKKRKLIMDITPLT